MATYRSSQFLMSKAASLVVLLLFANHALSNEKKAVSSQSAATQVDTRPDAATNYGHIPLSFEANRGQADPSVQFLSRGQGYTLFLRPVEAVLALRGREQAPPGTDTSTNLHGAPRVDASETSLIRMELIGANKHAALRREDEQITKTNYFIGNDPAKWQTDIPNYGRVQYSEIYPGIDLVYYGNQHRLEHDFVIAPHADPARIRISIGGTEKVRIDPVSGDLILTVGHSELRLLKPVTYQESSRQRISVASSYRLFAEDKIGFEVAAYNHSRPLTIDPVLVYSTYVGGSGDGNGNGDQGNAIAVDSTGSAYIVGTTYSVNFPTTPATFQSTNRSALAKTGGTVFVSKINPAGTALVFSTYIGGSGGDYGYAIAIDSSHHPYITGSTYSKDFPITCAGVRHSNAADTDSGATIGFVTKLLVAGNRIMYSTFLGGTGNYGTPPLGDVLQAIAVDAAGDAYVAGYTYSSEYPRTHGVFESHFKGNAITSMAVVTKMNSQGDAALYSTLLGGSGGDFANAIAIDAKGDAFIAGSTGSIDFPITAGAFQTVSHSLHGTHSAFVTELNPTGTDAVYSTYLGGSNGDSAQSIAVDSQGFAYVAGTTSSKDFPLTTGVLEDANSGVGNLLASDGPTGFASKLNPDGSALAYSTYVEGYGTSISALAVGGSGDVYIAGTVAQPNTGGLGVFQATPDALPTPASTGKSAFVVKLDPSATVLNYATLLGGGKNDSATSLALDASGSAYVTGAADSTDFPTTRHVFQSENGAASSGASNAFVSKFSLANEDNQTTYSAIATVPASAEARITASIPQNGLGAKFTPPANPPIANSDMLQTGPYAAAEPTINCGVPVSPVTVTVVPATGSRLYGAVNPAFSYTMSGLMKGEQIAVQVKVSTPRTHVGTHPVEVAISGPAWKYYEFIVNNGELTITPAPLTVTVNPAARLYGAPNPSFAYKAVGLVRGDTVSTTTTAALTSPVGSYPLVAAVSDPYNYILTIHDATLTITRAPLTVTATSLTIKKGHAIPKLTYAIAGFRNGETKSVVTGAPTLGTTATSNSKPGVYPIAVHVGTLTAANYLFETVNGSITIQ